MLVQLKVVQSSSLRKRVRYADVGSAKSGSVKQSQEKVRYADVGSAKGGSVKQSQEKGSVCGCWFSQEDSFCTVGIRVLRNGAWCFG